MSGASRQARACLRLPVVSKTALPVAFGCLAIRRLHEPAPRPLLDQFDYSKTVKI